VRPAEAAGGMLSREAGKHVREAIRHADCMAARLKP
jgi:hypothetical protein